MFDCVLPTNLGWQGTAFTSTGRVRITRGANARADVALDARCPCSTCARYSRSYLHHLFKCSEPLGPRLLCIHNLFHYHALMAEARTAIERGVYAAFARERLEQIDRHEHSDRRLPRADDERASPLDHNERASPLDHNERASPLDESAA
jgi:queuine tRNA-ribosyltransferase